MQNENGGRVRAAVDLSLREWVLRPGIRARGRAALVVAIAAVNRLAADGRKRHFGRDSAAVARHADHRSLPAAATVSIAGRLALVAAVLAPLGLVRETPLCVKG